MDTQELSDRAELRALVDRYAAESDKGNHEAYREIFAENLNLRLHSGGQVTEFHDVGEMIKTYKAFGAAKISFHQTGQQLVEFADGLHATGVVYLTALLVDDSDSPTRLYLRYYDKYEKIGGRWWITDRDQHILFTEH